MFYLKVFLIYRDYSNQSIKFLTTSAPKGLPHLYFSSGAACQPKMPLYNKSSENKLTGMFYLCKKFDLPPLIL